MSRGTQVLTVSARVSGTGPSPSLAMLSSILPLHSLITLSALQPRVNESTRFRLIPLRSPLLRESRLISLPSGTEMFHFPEFASRILCIRLLDDRISLLPGFPIQKSPGHADIRLLTGAYRSLSRLSSPSDAKASTRCSCQLVLLEKNFFLSLFNCQRSTSFLRCRVLSRVRTKKISSFCSFHERTLAKPRGGPGKT